MSKSRHYCITFFTKPKIKLPDKVRYAIYGLEECPTTGRQHWQSYVEFKSPQRFAAVKKMYDDDTLHIEPRQGTRDQAREYCMKDGHYEEHGEWISGQGCRTDLTAVVDRLKSGVSIKDIMLEEPELYCRYRNGLRDIAATITERNIPAWRNLEVVVYSGPTDKGKTRQAMAEATYKIEGVKLDWWQDYSGDKVICIDEYDNDLRITELLNILDGYKLRLNVKGSHTYANWDKVIITTNLTKDELHAKAKPAHRAALFRRITHWIDMWDEEVQG